MLHTVVQVLELQKLHVVKYGIYTVKQFRLPTVEHINAEKHLILPAFH